MPVDISWRETAIALLKTGDYTYEEIAIKVDKAPLSIRQLASDNKVTYRVVATMKRERAKKESILKNQLKNISLTKNSDRFIAKAGNKQVESDCPWRAITFLAARLFNKKIVCNEEEVIEVFGDKNSEDTFIVSVQQQKLEGDLYIENKLQEDNTWRLHYTASHITSTGTERNSGSTPLEAIANVIIYSVGDYIKAINNKPLPIDIFEFMGQEWELEELV